MFSGVEFEFGDWRFEFGRPALAFCRSESKRTLGRRAALIHRFCVRKRIGATTRFHRRPRTPTCWSARSAGARRTAQVDAPQEPIPPSPMVHGARTDEAFSAGRKPERAPPAFRLHRSWAAPPRFNAARRTLVVLRAHPLRPNSPTGRHRNRELMHLNIGTRRRSHCRTCPPANRIPDVPKDTVVPKCPLRNSRSAHTPPLESSSSAESQNNTIPQFRTEALPDADADWPHATD